MKRAEKESQVELIQKKFSQAKAVVLTDYRGLTVEEMTELRKKLREAEVEFRVVKNTLARLAARKANIEGLEPYLEGPTAIAFGEKDPVAPAKILHSFARDHKNLELKMGIVENRILDRQELAALATLPSREVLLAQLAGVVQAPLRNLGMVLSAPLRNMVYALEGIRKKQAQEA